MPRATTVRLPFGKQPAFPPWCVGCGTPEPGTTADTELTLDKDYTGSPTMKVLAPCCKTCERRMARWYWTRLALLVVVFFTFPLAGWLSALAARRVWEPLTAGWPPVLAGLPFILIAVGGLACGYGGVVLWTRYSPPAFDVEVAKDHSVEYRFRDSRTAAAFAELNAHDPMHGGGNKREPR
jgi:hypothetical protein